MTASGCYKVSIFVGFRSFLLFQSSGTSSVNFIVVDYCYAVLLFTRLYRIYRNDDEDDDEERSNRIKIGYSLLYLSTYTGTKNWGIFSYGSTAI